MRLCLFWHVSRRRGIFVFCLADFSLTLLFILILYGSRKPVRLNRTKGSQYYQTPANEKFKRILVKQTDMIGLSYPGFIVPIPNADEYNDFITTLPLSSSIKQRLSTSTSNKTLQNAAQPSKTGVMKRLRLLVDERIRLKRGYVFLQRG